MNQLEFKIYLFKNVDIVKYVNIFLLKEAEIAEHIAMNHYLNGGINSDSNMSYDDYLDLWIKQYSLDKSVIFLPDSYKLAIVFLKSSS